jgi:hypothetical protein
VAEQELSDRAREGLEHLQAAAKELIAAGHALLDAAGELVDDPAIAAQVVGAFGALAELARAAAANAVNPSGVDADVGGTASRVQRIKVS